MTRIAGRIVIAIQRNADRHVIRCFGGIRTCIGALIPTWLQPNRRRVAGIAFGCVDFRQTLLGRKLRGRSNDRFVVELRRIDGLRRIDRPASLPASADAATLRGDLLRSATSAPPG